MMAWLGYLLAFLIGELVGYTIRRTVEEEFHIPCIDDEDF